MLSITDFVVFTSCFTHMIHYLNIKILKLQNYFISNFFLISEKKNRKIVKMISVFAVSCLFGIGVQANHVNGEYHIRVNRTE